MDRRHSRWAAEDPTSENRRNPLHGFDESTASYIYDTNTLDSPSFSKDDSIESFAEDHIEKSDANIVKPTFKSILQAKKRLQAFSAAKQLRRHPSKDEKTEEMDKSDKMSPKKSKKALYPLDKAQAVVQEIEEIKQKEAEVAQEEKRKIDAIISVAYRNFSLRERSRSPSTEREMQFRKREIKSRNYRRSDSFKRRSVSPENYCKRSGKLVYPQNWAEYRQQGLTVVKDDELKSKVFPKVKHGTHELVAKFLTFDGPSPLMESFKVVSTEEKLENVPFPLLRITRSKPTLTYSLNSRKYKNSFLTRKQLFHVISRDRRAIIEKLINSASSKSQFQNRPLTSRPWYSKSWKRSTDAECTILENSVGLSFLQTYSDEEEENESEEIFTGHDVKEAKPVVKEIISNERSEETGLYITNHTDSIKSIEELEEERDTLTPEETPDMVLRKQKEEGAEDVKKQKAEQDKKRQKEEEFKVSNNVRDEREATTPEKIVGLQRECVAEVVKKKDKDELIETRKAIKELEEELVRRKALREEEEIEVEKEVRKVKKKKKKKVKRKEVSSDSEEEERPKKRKKKKLKAKKKKYEEDDEESDSSESDMSKKSKRKRNRKKSKVKDKKKEKSKKVDSTPKEHKTKKKEEDNEGDQKKKKKSGIADEFDIQYDEEPKKGKKKHGEEKGREISNDEEEPEVNEEKPAKKDEDDNKKKKRKHDSPDFVKDKENELLEDQAKSDVRILINDFDNGECTYESPQMAMKDRRSDTSRSRTPKETCKLRETSVKSNDSVKRKKYLEFMYDDVKSDEKSRDKHKSREGKYKMEIEQEISYGKQMEKRISRSGEDLAKEELHIKRETSKVKIEKPKDNKHRLEPVYMKTEPDWENLRSKRDRHRHGDYKESLHNFSDEFVGFPLEKDIYPTKEKHKHTHKKEIGTPDTEEYRENWEKESDPIWESEDEAPTKVRGKLNNSWESDEEIFERGQQVVESFRPISDVFDLEIPLNIKPFKRREIIDPDTELVLLKKQSLSLNEERRQLEIEKLRVKELELEVIKEVECKVKEDKKFKRRSKERVTAEAEGVGKKREFGRRGGVEKEEMTPKRGRWDKRMSSPKLPRPKLDIIDISQIKREMVDEDSSTNVSSTTSVNTTSVLENEYEEFMKALTSSPKKLPEKTRVVVDEINFDNSPQSFRLDKSYGGVKIPDPGRVKVTDNTPTNVDKPMSVAPPPIPQIVTILPKDIPLIPMPLPKAEVKPVPVPSPHVEVDKIPKPLINLSLSASITLDIGPKFTTPPVRLPGTTVNTLQAVITHSADLQKGGDGDAVKFSTASIESGLVRTKGVESTLPSKPFVFTSMVLPSKRLLNNSKVNLGDSDDEDRPTKPLMRLEDDFVNEDMLEDITSPVDQPNNEPEVNKEQAEPEPEPEKAKEREMELKRVEKDERVEREEKAISRSSTERESRRKRSPERYLRRAGSPKRSSYGSSKRESPPRRRGRESSPRRRGHSPKRHSPRRRSPKRRSPAKRRYSPRRSPSPKSRRRGSLSPRRRSPPRRSPSPKFRGGSPKRLKPKPPDKHPSISHKPPSNTSNRPKSPAIVTSPPEGLKRSVADSTISDDLLPQPSMMNMEEYTQSPLAQFYGGTMKSSDSPRRESLDARISQVLGLGVPAREEKERPRQIPTTYSNYNYEAARFSQHFDKLVEPKGAVVTIQQSFSKVALQHSKSNFVQVGNMVEILPTEDIPPPPVPVGQNAQRQVNAAVLVPLPRHPSKNEKSHIVQVGNMLQIVPADLPLAPPLPPEPKPEPIEAPVFVPPTPPVSVQEKQSAESAMRLKVAERREEREKRRQERERRRKEKDKRKREKERQRQIKLKQRTENMIKRALELEAEGLEEEQPEPEVQDEAVVQWPPLSFSVAAAVLKEAGKSILVRAGSRSDSPRLTTTERRKVVQFADGVRPGEGTSPSGGEELSSPPPRKKMPKEKRYKKTKLQKKNQKKKVKVKIIKKLSHSEGSDDDQRDDEDDDLPPPSPPPGSPPPHVFPPRLVVRPLPINSVQPYLAGIVPVVAAPQQQQFRQPQQQQIGIVMHPHHHPSHHHHGPPPPPPHHHHHHGPPPPPPHHHHPHFPPPPGPPHHHHGPPPPPPHHHGPPPPPGFSRPRPAPLPLHRFRPPHHHHGPPPPPFHH